MSDMRIVTIYNNTKDWMSQKLCHDMKNLLKSKFKFCKIDIAHLSPYIQAFYIHRTYNASHIDKFIIFLVKNIVDSEHNNIYDIIEDIKYTMHDKSLSRKPHLIVCWKDRKKKEIKDKYEYLQDYFTESIVCDTDRFSQFLLNDNPYYKLSKELFEHYNSVQTSVSPFSHKGPCSTEMFFGRSDLIETILTKYDGHAITGGRRIGKTSLLFKLEHVIQTENKYKYIPYYIDCSNVSSYATLINLIGMTLLDDDNYSCKLFNFSFEKLFKEKKHNKQDKCIFLMLDEIDKVLNSTKHLNESAVYFGNAVRSISYKGLLKIIFSGFRGVYETFNNTQHPLWNLCEMNTLGLLNKDEVRQLITFPLVKYGIVFEPKDKIVDDIYRHTNGYPSMVQFFGDELFKLRKSDVIKEDVLQEVLHGNRLINFIFEMIMLNTTPFERLICVWMNDKEKFTQNDILILVRKNKIPLKDPTRHIQIAINHLYNNNIITDDSDSYSFMFPLMASVIKKKLFNNDTIETLIEGIENEY